MAAGNYTENIEEKNQITTEMLKIEKSWNGLDNVLSEAKPES